MIEGMQLAQVFDIPMIFPILIAAEVFSWVRRQVPLVQITHTISLVGNHH
jgi:hypothetical protein